MRNIVLVVVLALMACTKVVTTTTTEVRANRYGLVEFTRAAARDSIMAYAQRALSAENIKVQKVDRAAGSITAGPVAIAASADEPALHAELSISAQASGSDTRVRIFATSLLEPNQTGGRDARLMDLVQRIERRLDRLLSR